MTRCVLCNRPTGGVGDTRGTDVPLCDPCYSERDALRCDCGTITPDGERCDECAEALWEVERER